MIKVDRIRDTKKSLINNEGVILLNPYLSSIKNILYRPIGKLIRVIIKKNINKTSSS